jgi:hypothetical protein
VCGGVKGRNKQKIWKEIGKGRKKEGMKATNKH